MEAFKHLNIGTAPWLSEAYAEVVLASGDVEIRVLIELCQRILDKNGMPADWSIRVAIAILKEKGDIVNCGMYRGVKLLEHAMKVVAKVLENRLRRVVMIDDMQFSFMPGKGTIEVVYILRWIQEEYISKQQKLYMCFVDLET